MRTILPLCTLLLAFAVPAGAQAPSRPPVTVAPGRDVPTDQWPYAALHRLQQWRDVQLAGYPDGSTRTRAMTRDGLAGEIARHLAWIEERGPVADRDLRTRPILRQDLRDLLREFSPELRARGVQPIILRSRLLALERSQPVASRPFRDVPPDHWAFQAVETLRRAGIVAGYPDGAFSGQPTPPGQR